MQPSSKFRDWYAGDVSGSHVDAAREAFNLAIQKFTSDLTQDDRKKVAVQDATSLEDLRSAVSTAEKRYLGSRRPAGKWLVKFSQRMHHYGTVLDAFAQHHPEYVALAWGAMKFLFTAVINHEDHLAALSKGLAKIAGLLPHSELISALYPTKKMKAAMAELYAIIIRFLVRAQDWLQESSLSRALHSITRPAKLRYDDLIEEIELRLQNVTAFATAASQAEIRDMRLEIMAMRDQQLEANCIMSYHANKFTENHAISLNHQLDTNHRLSDLQLSQILASLSSPLFIDPIKALQYGIHQNNKRRRSRTQSALSPFWFTNKFQEWSQSEKSSLVIIRGTYSLRTQLRDFGTNLVELVSAAQVAIVWTLRITVDDGKDVTAIDLLKYLIWQALGIERVKRTERFMALSCAKFQSARTEEDWFQLLAAVLADLDEVFIIVDTELISPILAPLTKDFSFRKEFSDIFKKLGDHAIETKVKVLLISYGEMRFCRAHDGDGHHEVITVGLPNHSSTGKKQGRTSIAQRRGPRGQTLQSQISARR
ncbi:uncharacterized protein K460DRAFT_333887 [Cucurbitaria berberidis CBS 394.84]|uniref:DUF7708 domain-containing protein n=1 Tax=Cucurbitaria berberidis CBS 394.84 TaxID=1168544 RepID=A0A9P4GMX9_9PLEO|nr:uncharacterized protein K460DRAFT_333887 [Cucurbitaria berberidis CBS 394.84]KAF1848142.1 hypothetical protein K460DRAFT_333887 [Cucurbitaria berberidis CBS 394.84]